MNKSDRNVIIGVILTIFIFAVILISTLGVRLVVRGSNSFEQGLGVLGVILLGIVFILSAIASYIIMSKG